MIEEGCGKSSGERALLAQDAALHLFQIAALMLGHEQDAVSVVEETVAGVETDPCADGLGAHDEARARLIKAALRRMDRLSPGAFGPPATMAAAETCIESDDLSGAGLSSEQIAALIDAPGRARLREWLEGLEPALRVIFVLRAVMRQDVERTSLSLRESGVIGAESWGTARVGSAYRQALCSLATSLLSAASAAPV